MAGDWTSMYAIMQDLSVAQGGMPVVVNGIVSASDRPPTPVIDEDYEVEEQYYADICTGSGYTKPDLGLIKEMLDMVRDKGISDSEDEITLISKTTPVVSVCDSPTTSPSAVPSNIKIKPSRNIAIMSLLKLESDRKAEILRLEALDKENIAKHGCENNKSNLNNKKYPLQLAPSNMFKKKVQTSSQNNVTGVITPEEKIVPPKAPKSGEYKPSTMASEYYKMYVERNEAKQLKQQDIWSKVEKQMKEIDVKRKMEMLSPTTSQSSASISQSPKMSQTSPNISQTPLNISETSPNISQSPNNSESSTRFITSPSTSESSQSEANKVGEKMPFSVILPQQRHMLTGECVVCAVVKQHGYDVDGLPVDI